MSADVGPVRIGEFARRVGVSRELLRAWERRYGLLRPVRSEGGFRLYTSADAERVARMRRALASGLSAAEAARSVGGASSAAEGLAEATRSRLSAAIRAYDEATLQTALDDALSSFSLETVLAEVVLPTLRRVGEEWERGELEVGNEHFASNLIRERLLGLTRVWSRGGGPLAILACAPGERHDIGLIAFGLLLRTQGWRILFLGADTPVATLARACAVARPRFVVVASVDEALLEAAGADLRRLARSTSLALSGPGASARLCSRLRLARLDGDPIAAASALERTVSAPENAPPASTMTVA